jgi:hypothetical protein
MVSGFLRLTLLAGLIALGVGCGRNDGFKPTIPMRGQILCDGQPPIGASIILYPKDAPDPRVRPSGKVGSDGWYTLSTYYTNDGAPAGNYAVSLVWLPDGWSGGGGEPPDKFHGRYRNPETSGLQVEIVRGSDHLPTITLPKIDP